MARQKLPPPSASSHSDDSSSDEEHVVSQQTPSNPGKRQVDSSSSSEGEEEEEEEEVPPTPTPSKKKAKVSAAGPSQPPPKKSSGAIQRIWAPEAEKALIEALSRHLAQNGQLPPRKSYASFLSTVNANASKPLIPFNDAQMHNKIRHMRRKCTIIQLDGKKPPTSSNPHATSFFQLWADLFAADKVTNKASNKRASLNIGGTSTTDGAESKGVMTTAVSSGGETSDGAGNAGGVGDGRGNGGGTNGAHVPASNSYLGLLIKDMISTQQCPYRISTVEDVLVRIGHSKAHELEVKAMILSRDAIKLSARKLRLESKLFQALIDAMLDDN